MGQLLKEDLEYKESLVFGEGELYLIDINMETIQEKMENWWSREGGERGHMAWVSGERDGDGIPAASSSDTLLMILLSGSVCSWLHIKSLGELLNNVDALASCQTNWNSLGSGPSLWWFQGCGWEYTTACVVSRPVSMSELSPSGGNQGSVSLYADLSPWTEHFQNILPLSK